MKRCTVCGEEKDLCEFHKDKKTKSGVRSECNECRSKKSRERRKTDKEYRDKQRGYVRARKKEIKEYLYSQKKPCVVCSESDPVCIDFHHLDKEDKDFTIGTNWGRNKEILQKEIDKCVCLCANCHRKVHAGVIDLSAYVETT